MLSLKTIDQNSGCCCFVNIRRWRSFRFALQSPQCFSCCGRWEEEGSVMTEQSFPHFRDDQMRRWHFYLLWLARGSQALSDYWAHYQKHLLPPSSTTIPRIESGALLLSMKSPSALSACQQIFSLPKTLLIEWDLSDKNEVGLLELRFAKIVLKLVI